MQRGNLNEWREMDQLYSQEQILEVIDWSDGITYLSKEDIAAMKLYAIIQSGKRLKDFIDIYFLLQHFTMDQLIGFFLK